MSDNTTLQQRVDFLERQVEHLSRRMGELATQYAALLTQVEALRRYESRQPARPHSSLFKRFGSIDALVAQAEEMFDCKNGDHRSHHQVWCNDDRASGYAFYPYVHLALIASEAIPDAPEQLRQCLYTALSKLKATCKSERPVLYWRWVAPERIQEESTSDTEPLQFKIRTRIVIPEADFSVVDELIFQDGVDKRMAVLRE
jgi:hypothetical protein